MSDQETELEDISYALTGEELRSTLTLGDQDRFTYFIDKSKAEDQVWTLGVEEELIVLAGPEDTPFIVVFPHPEFAQEWIEGTDIEEVELVALSAADMADHVLPSLQEEGIRVSVFPTSEKDGREVDASELAKSLV